MKRNIMIIIILGLTNLIGGQVFSEEMATESGGFSVTALDHLSQKPLNSYYDLRVVPGEQLALPVQLHNSTSHEMTIQLEANTATTNRNGITSYQKDEDKPQDSSLLFPFSKMAKLPSETVVVPANTTKVVTIEVTTPSETFEGEVLGGLRFSEVEPETPTSSSSGVTAKIAYVIGALLTQTDTRPLPEMKLMSVQTEQRNYVNYISTTLQNAAPRIVKELKVTAKVYDKKNTLVYDATNEAMRMAPNSNFNFGISLEDQAFIPGTYQVVVEGSADGEAFSFTKELKIDNKEAKEWNSNAVHVEKQSMDATIYLLIIGALIVVMLFQVLIKKKKGVRG